MAIAAGLIGSGGVVIIGFSALAVPRGNAALATDIAIVVFNLLALGWVVLPVATFASDDLLDPTKLALLPLRRRDLMTLLGVAALVGVAPLATLLATTGLAVGVATDGLQALVALIACILEVAFCVMLSRVVAAALSGLLRSRRGRDLGIALTLLVALSFQLINPVMQHFLPDTAEGGSSALHALADPMRLTPPGLLATTPLLVQQGHPGPALGRLLLVALIIAAGLMLWERLVARSLVRVDTAGHSRRRQTPLAPRAVAWLLPKGRAGAVAAKDLRYLTRDPRRALSQLLGVLMPALVIVLGPASRAGTSPARWAVFVVCLIAAFAALQGANRFGVDGTAVWMLMATWTTRLDARRDLLGGDLAMLIVTLPLTVVVGVGTAALVDGWTWLPAALGLAVALMLVTAAGSGLIAVLAPFAVPDNPRNAFSTGGAGQGCAAGLITMGLMVAGPVACAPLLLLLPGALEHTSRAVALLIIGPAYGAAVALVVRRQAAEQWSKRAPDVLQTLVSGRS
jgi:ABC-2 type transport system permease protein